jgi:adenine/guanine phosphoribosyltransferase-like PRPP-binding protein
LNLAPHEFWQDIYPAGSFPNHGTVEFSHFYPADLPNGRQILLPIRVLPGDGTRAVASLIINQASFAVEDALAAVLAERLAPFEPQMIVGVPTLGLPLASNVARRLGHSRMVALGTSRKFWYDDALSEPMASITSPSAGKTLYLDPRMLALLKGRRVAVVDDVLSTGASMASVLRLLAKAGIVPVTIAAAMLQGTAWEAKLKAIDPLLVSVVRASMRSPLLGKTRTDKWMSV